jgi:hypothetical protein
MLAEVIEPMEAALAETGGSGQSVVAQAVAVEGLKYIGETKQPLYS